MPDIVRLREADLQKFRERLESVTYVDLWIDPLDRGVKVKPEGHSWSPAYGDLTVRES